MLSFDNLIRVLFQSLETFLGLFDVLLIINGLLIISLFFLYEILKVHLKHKIQYIGLIRKLRLLHHGHSTNVLLFVHHLIEEQVLHELLSKHRPLVLCFRGDNEIRTRDPLLARQVLSQLSYTPRVGLNGLEPSTSRLSGVRSNQLSYKPFFKSGSHLLSHAVSSIVPWAAWVLTIVFGMWTGVSPRRIATGSFFVPCRNIHN